ncbi:hypothetical protein [uncultured Cyclobacterium sp.]|uniref:hypothetical protein n=1 Tax=uncultured Cyclobacterium sp. TaxID=453820 RepID=UPI0030EF8B5A|tara:strand:- start:1123 stop:1392 length:270 start_codon:yes stop_codon:yes gene_type:complete
MQKTIILKNDSFQKLHVIRLEFPYDFELKEIVKGFPECKWYLKERVWAVPYTPTQVSELLQYFKEKNIWLDYSRIQKVDLPENILIYLY